MCGWTRFCFPTFSVGNWLRAQLQSNITGAGRHAHGRRSSQGLFCPMPCFGCFSLVIPANAGSALLRRSRTSRAFRARTPEVTGFPRSRE
ncbi:hypothetical protein [Lysobacter gummosus]|uniref:hypothetical protein n=1 Tax=Lysobacter gummosus TaxID=262324 RepID=UPI003624FA5F